MLLLILLAIGVAVVADVIFTTLLIRTGFYDRHPEAADMELN